MNWNWAALCSQREILPDPMEPFPRFAGCSGLFAYTYHAAKGVLGGDYTYHYTEAGFQKRFWFSHSVIRTLSWKPEKSGIRFLSLCSSFPTRTCPIPYSRVLFTDECHGIHERWIASWDVTYYLNGWLFNRIPLLKKLKWREVLSCRGLYGNLSDKNNPAFQQDLFPFSCWKYHHGT